MKSRNYLLLWIILLISPVLVAQERLDLPEGYDLCFFPEGEHLIPGERCMVAFRNLSDRNISGYIMDEHGDSITSLSFQNQECGLFQLIPEKDKRYFAAYCGADQVWKRTELPFVDPGAYALQVNQTGSKIFITWHTAKENLTGKEPFILKVCSGDQVYYDQVWDFSKKSIVLNKKDFLSGLLRIKLFDAKMNLLSERPLLCVNTDQVNISYWVNKDIRDKKAQLCLKLSLESGEILAGQYSVYVTRDSIQKSNTLYTVHPSEDMEKSLKYLSSDYLKEIQNTRLYDAYVLSDMGMESMDEVNLDEIEVNASRIIPKDKDDDMFEKYADYKLTAKQIERIHPFNLASLIRQIPGLVIRRGCVMLARNYGEVAICLDGTMLSEGKGGMDIMNEKEEEMAGVQAFENPVLQMIDVSDIKSVQLIKGAGRAAFGMKGFKGVLSITTKKGNENYMPPVKEVKKLVSQHKDSSVKNVYYANWQLDTSEKGELILDLDADKATGKLTISISGYTNEGILVCGSVPVSL